MNSGLYRVVANIQINVYEADAFVTHRRTEPVHLLQKGDFFMVLQSSEDDRLVRALIMVGGIMASIRVGENIPGVAFKLHAEATDGPKLSLSA